VPAAASTDITPVNGRALIVGRLWSEERYKGHDLLIDVWPAVQRACPHAELMIVGDGDDRPRLETRVREAGLSAAIHFAGLVSQDALRRHFMESQVFVLPSEGEGFGLVFLEAMRAARPCIAAPGAAEEIVVNGQTGRVIAARDTHSLTGALIELLGNPALCESLGAAARRRFDDHYTAACFKERLLEALSEAHATC
jgi:phosphatidylinositol alpha-1,6-mannosyltransferase